MDVSIHASGPLTGAVELPGDRRLTLMTLAYGMLLRKPLTIENAPPVKWISPLLDVLQSYGATSEFPDSTTLTFQGAEWPEEVTINRFVPVEVLHIIVASIVFDGKRVIIEGGETDRSNEVDTVISMLAQWGLDRDQVIVDQENIILDGAVFVGVDTFEAASGQDVETALAISLVTGQPVALSYVPQTAAHSVRLAGLLGCNINSPEPGSSIDRDHELTRRMARLKGGKALTTVSFQWEDTVLKPIALPGDSTLAAAICGVAALVPRSKITVQQVVWEQDRRGYFDTLRRMKSQLTWESSKRKLPFDSADITVQWAPLECVHVTIDQSYTMLSEVIVLAIVAAVAYGKMVISIDTGTLFPGRHDCRTVATGLCAAGVHAGDFETGIVLNGVHELRGDRFDAAGSNAASLAFAVACCAITGGTEITGIASDIPYLDDFFHSVEMVGTSSLSLS